MAPASQIPEGKHSRPRVFFSHTSEFLRPVWPEILASIRASAARVRIDCAAREDAAQSAALALLEQFRKGTKVENLKAYASRIALTEALKLASYRRRFPLPDEDGLLMHVPQNLGEDEQTFALLREVLESSLSVTQRMILHLKVDEQNDLADIMKCMDMGRTKVTTELAKIRLIARRIYTNYLSGDDDRPDPKGGGRKRRCPERLSRHLSRIRRRQSIASVLHLLRAHEQARSIVFERLILRLHLTIRDVMSVAFSRLQPPIIATHHRANAAFEDLMLRLEIQVPAISPATDDGNLCLVKTSIHRHRRRQGRLVDYLN